LWAALKTAFDVTARETISLFDVILVLTGEANRIVLAG
jgi:hypothetical protein